MNDEKIMRLNLSIPERYRNLLRRMAAERMMSDPSEVVTGASIATEILLTTLKELSGETKNEDQEGGEQP